MPYSCIIIPCNTIVVKLLIFSCTEYYLDEALELGMLLYPVYCVGMDIDIDH
jgi:hypothetical protein